MPVRHPLLHLINTQQRLTNRGWSLHHGMFANVRACLSSSYARGSQKSMSQIYSYLQRWCS